MAQGSVQSLKRLDEEDARKTYRYLRIGMIGAVVALGVSILIELGKVDFRCLQTSISAYYYTPVRAIFVGSMIVVGFALIVYKGRSSREDVCLNFAGMFAPVVAVAPTTSVGLCWSRPPHPRPVFEDSTLAPWLVANINNNIRTLLWAGLGGLVLSLIFVVVAKWKKSKRLAEGITAPFEGVKTGTWVSLVLTGVLLFIGWALIWSWNDFYTLAHGYGAVLFFIFLWFAIVFNVARHWKTKSAPEGAEKGAFLIRLTRFWNNLKRFNLREFWVNLKEQKRFFWLYAAVALLMAGGFFLIPWIWAGSDHMILWLEAWEILWFAVYWIIQTAENWDEEVVEDAPVALADQSRPLPEATA